MKPTVEEFLKLYGISLSPYQKEILEKVLTTNKIYIPMCKNGYGLIAEAQRLWMRELHRGGHDDGSDTQKEVQ